METARNREISRSKPDTRAPGGTEVIKSWQRCMSSYNLDPSQRWKAEVLSGAELRHVSHRSAVLLKTAMPEMQRLFQLVQGLDFMVLLADPDATILARNIDPAHLPVCSRLALREGAIWDERIAGTNGIGTAVRDACPIFLGEGEHWRFCFSLLASYAVPVFNAVGQVAGVINLAAFNGTDHSNVAPLVLDTLQQSGRRIEEQLFREYHAGERILTLGPAEGCSAPLVAINREGEVTGATHGARVMTGWTDDVIRTHPNLLDRLATEDRVSFRRAEENVIRAALALAHGNVTATARNLGIGRATLYRKMKVLGLR